MRKGSIKLLLINITVAVLNLFSPLVSFSQALVINNSGYLVANGAVTIYVKDAGWTNSGTFTKSTSTVIFDATTAQSIAGANGTDFYNLTISGTNTKTFNSAGTVERLITVNNNNTLNANGNLTLLASNGSNASVGALGTGASVTNNVTVQSYFTGGASTRAFRGVSSPINDVGLANKTYKQLQSYFIITGPGNTANGFDKGNSISPNGVTIKTYNEASPLSSSQFTNLPDINQSATPGKGFFMFYRGNRTANYNAGGTYATGSKVVSPYATPEIVTAQYTGPINQGAINVALSYTNNSDGDVYRGSNLVGNPYPSVIDWHSVLAASTSSIDTKIYVIKQNGSFATYTTAGATVNGGTRYIQPGQAFYVQATASSQTLSFIETCKDPYPSSGTVMRFLSAPSTGRDMLMSTSSVRTKSSSMSFLRFNLQQDTVKEEALIALFDGTKPELDKEDALYFAGGPLTLFSKSADNKNLSINFLPEFTINTEIKLHVGASEPGQFALNFTDLSATSGSQVFLEDKYLSKTVDITPNSSYSFLIDKNIPTSFGSERFKLLFRPNVSLPTFTAQKVYGGSEVKWFGLDNLRNNVFVVERSTDGKNYKSIGTILKFENIAIPYTLLDNKPETGVNYYRLKLPETDSIYSYTQPVSLDYSVDGNEPQFVVYPNPVKDILHVNFKEEAKNAQLVLYNLSGQKIKTFKVTDSFKADCNLIGLETGMYILKGLNGQGKEMGVEKIIKE